MKQQLLDELNSARNDLYAALQGIPEEELKRPNAIDGYSVESICGLTSAWENRLLTAMQQITQGDESRVAINALGMSGAFFTDGYYDNASFNQRQQAKRRGWPWREVLNELVWNREETGWTLANMDEVELFTQRDVETEDRGVITICPADIVQQLIAQDRMRAESIRAWRRQYEL